MRGSRGVKGGTAERILAAANDLFCTRGFDGVSVRDVARAAGVQKALVFYHFGSKEALFQRVLEGYSRAHREALEGAFAGTGRLRERLHRTIDAYLDFMAEHHRYALLVQREATNPDTHPYIQRGLASLFDWLRSALAEVAPPGGPLAAPQLFVTFSAMVIHYFTYAPVLKLLWGEDPLRAHALELRRRHVHVMVDLVLDELERGKG